MRSSSRRICSTSARHVLGRVGGILRKGAVEDVVERVAELGAPSADPRRRVVGVREQHGRAARAREHDGAGEALERDRRERVAVGRRGRVAAAHDLGREVGDGADELAGRRERRLGAGAGEAEVGEEGVIARRDEHVLRLDVAVHEADGVRRIERVGDLREQIERPARIERAVADQVDQRRPVDEAHREVQPVARIPRRRRP